MGKAADNERIKLDATFYNNSAVAAYVAGGLLPALPIYMKIAEGTVNPWQILVAGCVSGLMVVIATIMRIVANKEIAKIQD